MRAKDRISRIDNSDMLSTLLDFPNQCRIAREIGARSSLSRLSVKPKVVVWCGMGGSAIGGDVVASYSKDKITMPMIINRHYTIPSYVNKQSLVIISSYSGNTEEALSCYAGARRRGARILVLTSGGALLEKAARHRAMLIAIPRGLPPRCALGYSSIPVIMAFAKLGLMKPVTRQIDEVADVAQRLRARLTPEANNRVNIAKKLASELHGRLPLIYGSADCFEPVVYRWRTQMAENAKTLSLHHLFPELTHNEIEAFESFSKIPTKLIAVILKDVSDHARVKRRMEIAKRIIRKKGIKVLEVTSSGKTILARMISVMYIGDWTSFYLAIMNRVDPTPVGRIQFLKRRLSQE